MTTPITYPPDQITQWGLNEVLLNQSTWISYIGVDGSIWYLAGPLAPIAGAQDGVVLKKFMGLMAPVDMLELKGARQDGATFQDAVYDPGEIMLAIEASGTATGGINPDTPNRIRNVMRQWISAWDAKQAGILSVFTPDMGEWWCNARWAKNISDQFVQDYTWTGKQALTWNIKNYDAFWMSVDSTSEFGANLATATVNFETLDDSSTLPDSFTSFYTPDGTTNGTCGIKNGAAQLIPSGTGDIFEAQNIYGTATDTDNQIVTIQLAGTTLADLFDVIDPNAYLDVWARCNSAGDTGVRLRLSVATHSLCIFNAGTLVYEEVLLNVFEPRWGEIFTIVAGDDESPYNYTVLRNGYKVFKVADTGHLSTVGADYRLSGFGMSSALNLGIYTKPLPIANWSVADNTTIAQSGYLPLTNIGDQEAWPRFLCYGPGNFSFSNGPGSTDMITFGPLEDGQVVLVTTDPDYRSVVDLTPSQPTTQMLSKYVAELEALISFATNNNVPPLLQQFESLFGIVPPQGNLASLLVGKFTNPLPGAPYGVTPPTYQIAVSIDNGGPTSKVVAAVTPMRKWPL